MTKGNLMYHCLTVVISKERILCTTLDDSDLQIDLTQSLKPHQEHRSFLITYSKANMDRFPTRITFANTVLEAIVNATPNIIITYWSCSKKKHIDGSPHHHFSVKSSGPNRWEPIKLYLEDTYGILVHFFSQAFRLQCCLQVHYKI